MRVDRSTIHTAFSQSLGSINVPSLRPRTVQIAVAAPWC